MLKKSSLVAIFIGLLWLTAVALQPTVGTLAQNNTPTPPPLFFIPTATPLPTPTLSPSQIVGALGNYGLQPTDLPGFTPGKGNGVYSLDEWAKVISELYPEQSVVATSLTALYRTYGVVGVSVAEYFTQPCVGQVIFGLGTIVHGLISQTNVQSLANDPNLAGLYAGLYNWTQTKLEGVTGRTYTAPVSAELCSVPSTQYVLEFPVDRLLIVASVYAPNTTDLSLVAATLRNLAGVVEQRAQPVNTIIAAAPTEPPEPTATPTPVGFISLTDPNDLTRLNPNWRYVPKKPGEDAYVLNADGSITLIASHRSTSAVCYKYAGDFEVTARYTLGPHVDYQGIVLTVRDPQSSARFHIGFWDSQDCCNRDWLIWTGGASNTNTGIWETTWNLDERKAYTPSRFLRITRSANSIFFAYSSADGTNWRTERENLVLAMPSEVEICLEVTSDRGAEGFFATFDSVTIKPR